MPWLLRMPAVTRHPRNTAANTLRIPRTWVPKSKAVDLTPAVASSFRSWQAYSVSYTMVQLRASWIRALADFGDACYAPERAEQHHAYHPDVVIVRDDRKPSHRKPPVHGEPLVSIPVRKSRVSPQVNKLILTEPSLRPPRPPFHQRVQRVEGKDADYPNKCPVQNALSVKPS